MTANLGGASFELSVNLQGFKTQLDQAGQDAQAAATAINTMLAAATDLGKLGEGAAALDKLATAARVIQTSGDSVKKLLDAAAASASSMASAVQSLNTNGAQIEGIYKDAGAAAEKLYTSLETTRGKLRQFTRELNDLTGEASAKSREAFTVKVPDYSPVSAELNKLKAVAEEARAAIVVAGDSSALQATGQQGRDARGRFTSGSVSTSNLTTSAEQAAALTTSFETTLAATKALTLGLDLAALSVTDLDALMGRLDTSLGRVDELTHGAAYALTQLDTSLEVAQTTMGEFVKDATPLRQNLLDIKGRAEEANKPVGDFASVMQRLAAGGKGTLESLELTSGVIEDVDLAAKSGGANLVKYAGELDIVATAATSAAAALKTVVAPAATPAPAPVASPGAATATQAPLAQAARQTQALAAAQTQLAATTTPATQAVAAQGQATVLAASKLDDYRKSLLTTQQALNALVTGRAGAEKVEPGATAIEDAAASTLAAIDALNNADPGEALLLIREAGIAGAEGINELNASIATLEKKTAESAEDMQRRFDAMRQLGLELTDEMRAQEAAIINGDYDEEDNAYTRALREQNAQAKALTSANQALLRVEEQLTAESRALQAAAEREAAAEQKRIEKIALETQAIKDRFAARRADADANVQAIKANPVLQDQAYAAKALTDAGVKAKDAETAVAKLHAAIQALNGTSLNRDVQHGLDLIDGSAKAATIALAEMGQGNIADALDAERVAIFGLREALNEVTVAAERARQNLSELSTKEEQTIAAGLKARQQALSQALAAAQQSEAAFTAEADKRAEADQRRQTRLAAVAAERAAREQQVVLRGQTFDATQGSGDPVGAARIAQLADVKTSLEAVGFTAKEADTAVHALEKALVAANKAGNIKELPEGLTNSRLAADGAHKALAALGAGDVDRALRGIEDSLAVVRAGLAETTIASARLQQQLGNRLGTDDERAQVAALNARLVALGQTEAGLVRAAGAEALHGREIRAAKQATDDIREAEKARAEATRATNQRAQQLRTESRDTQSFLNDIGASGLGRIVGGGQRIGALLESAGFSVATGGALALAVALTAVATKLIEGVKDGLAFNAFLQDTHVRLEAATGSARAASVALADLQTKSRGKEYGSFGMEDLAHGQEVLYRLGQDSEAQQKRVADIAAATGETYGQTTERIASFYDLVKNNRPFSEQIETLQKAGILSAQWAGALRAAATNGSSVEERVELLNAALGRFDGTSEKAGRTASGAFQRVKNSATEAMGALTGPAFEAGADAMNRLADLMASDKFITGAHNVGEVAVQVYKMTSGVGEAIIVWEKLHGLMQKVGVAAPDPVKPQTPDKPPPSFNFPIGEARYDAERTAYEAGRKAVDAYAEGFTAESQTAFADLSETVERHMQSLGGGKLSSQQNILFNGTIEPLLAEMVTQIQKTGTVQEETTARAKAALGDQGDAVLKLVEYYRQLHNVEGQIATAKSNVAAAQDRVDLTTTTAGHIAEIDQKAIDDATALATKHANDAAAAIEAVSDEIEGIRDDAKSIDDAFAGTIASLTEKARLLTLANKQAADAARDAIQAAQDSLADYQEGVNDRRAGAKAALDAEKAGIDQLQQKVKDAQDKQNALSQAATEHQAAFQAAINGTIALFDQEHEQQDELTRAIIAKWDAEISGSKRASDEANQRVRADTEREHLLTLEYAKRIQAARQAGNLAGAAALEKERDRVLANERRNGEVNRAAADVANDRLGDRTEDANKAAAQQGAKDTRATTRAEAEVKAAQAVVTAAQAVLDVHTKAEEQAQAAENEEIKRRQATIAHMGRVESDRARNAQLAIDGINEEIRVQGVQRAAEKARHDKLIEEANDRIEKIRDDQAAQKIRDDQAIADAKTIKDADDKYFADKLVGDKAVLDNAKLILEQLGNQKTVLDTQITSLDALLARQDERNEKELAYLNTLRQELNLPVLTPYQIAHPEQKGAQGGDAGTGNVGTNNGLPMQGPQPQSGGASTQGTGEPGLLPGTDGPNGAPGGYHPEVDDQRRLWYVPNGKTLADFGGTPAGQAAAPSAAPAEPPRPVEAPPPPESTMGTTPQPVPAAPPPEPLRPVEPPPPPESTMDTTPQPQPPVGVPANDPQQPQAMPLPSKPASAPIYIQHYADPVPNYIPGPLASRGGDPRRIYPDDSYWYPNTAAPPGYAVMWRPGGSGTAYPVIVWTGGSAASGGNAGMARVSLPVAAMATAPLAAPALGGFGARSLLAAPGSAASLTPLTLTGTHHETGVGGGVSIHIGTVNASDPAEVESMLTTIEQRIWGGADLGFELSKRGGLVSGRTQGR